MYQQSFSYEQHVQGSRTDPNCSPNNTNPCEYIAYDQLPAIDPSINVLALLEQIKAGLEEKTNWTLNLAALNTLRQINKYYPADVNEVCRILWPSIVPSLDSLRSVVSKTSMLFIQELFQHKGAILYDEIIYRIEPVLVQKVNSDKLFIKEEAQKAYEIMLDNCLKDSLLIALSKSTLSKNAAISELSFKALERALGNMNAMLTQLQPNTYKELFISLIYALNGKRMNNYKSAERIVRGIYTVLGEQAFTQLVLLMGNEGILKNEDVLKLQKVFQDKEVKPKDSIKNYLKESRMRMNGGTNDFQQEQYAAQQSQQQFQQNSFPVQNVPQNGYQNGQSFGVSQNGQPMNYPTNSNFTFN